MNILLIHSDQHRYDCVGVNGHTLLRTPNLDRLASEGVNFSHAFTPTAICTPARACLLTGQWPSQHQCVSLPPLEAYHPVADDAPIWPRLLSEAGYTLGYVGKYHRELTGTPADHGFDTYHSLDAYRQWREALGIPPEPRTRGTLGYFGEPDPHATDDQTCIAWGADRAIDMLRDGAASGKPFVVRWDPQEPHLPCLPPKPYDTMYNPADITPWPSFADTLEGKPHIQRQQLLTWGVEDYTWDDWSPTVAYYLGVISHLDDQVGRVLDELDALGVADDTLVIYTTDHGDYCGGHRQIDKHFNIYDDVMRVPLIVRWPGAIDAGQTCDAFVTHELDLATTICAAAGVAVPDSYEGADLRDIAKGNVARDAVYGQWTGAQLGLYTQRMIRTRDWKYGWNATDIDELYDLHTDPAELTNRIHDPACAAILTDLRRRLFDWMESIGDRMANGWTRRQLIEERKL